MRDDAYPDQNAAYIVFTSLGDDKRSERLLRQEVNTVVPAKPEFMYWPNQSSCIGHAESRWLHPRP